jgi:predicted HAD superfamily Cof-like phosphohydrolase
MMSETTGNYFDDVGQFHAKFDLPLANSFVLLPYLAATPSDVRRPSLPAADEIRYRTNFMLEELEEFVAACRLDNLHDAADALADLVWVALGTAHHLGLPFDAIWAEVRRANLAKDVGPPDPAHKRPGERIRKPPGWTAPDHTIALGLARSLK